MKLLSPELIQALGSKCEYNDEHDSGRIYQFLQNWEAAVFSGGATRLIIKYFFALQNQMLIAAVHQSLDS